MTEAKPADELPLVFVPGLAADGSVFAPQKAMFPQLVVPPWLPPEHDESLQDYARRMAESVRSPSKCILGGTSFGGMLALEMARFLDPQAIVLIGSARRPSELPKIAKTWREWRMAVDYFPLTPVQWGVGVLKHTRRWKPLLADVASQFRNADRELLRWSFRKILGWQNEPRVDCPVYRVHGDRDRVIPIEGVDADEVVEGGGHVITLSHPAQVNAFIQRCIERIASEQKAALEIGNPS